MRGHWAYHERQDGRHSPAEVLARVCGRLVAPEELHRIFYATRFGRTLNRFGYARFRHWRVYAERGLPGEAVAVWLYGETLTVTFADEPLAQYRVSYQPGEHHLAHMHELERFETPYQSPQWPLWEWDDSFWLSVIRLPQSTPRQKLSSTPGWQLSLPFGPDHASATS